MGIGRSKERARQAEYEAAKLRQELKEAKEQVDELKGLLDRRPAVSSHPLAALSAVAAGTQTDPLEAPVEEEPEEEGPALPAGVEADVFGVWPRPMNGGNNMFIQFRRHFRMVTSSLYRLLHNHSSSTRPSATTFSPLESVLWTAVKCYCLDAVVKEELDAQKDGRSILANPGTLHRLQEVVATYKGLQKPSTEALNALFEAATAQGAPGEPSALIQCMLALKQRAATVVRESRQQTEARRQLEEQVAGINAMLPNRQEALARDVETQVAERERQVAALNVTAGRAAAGMEGLDRVLRVRVEEKEWLQQQLRQVLHDEGQGPAATAVQAQITELREHIVRRQAELDAMDADRNEALKAIKEAAEGLSQLQQVSINLQAPPDAGGPIDQAGTAEERRRQLQRQLESELRIARSELLAVQLEGRRRQQNIAHMHTSIRQLQASYEQQQQEAFHQAMQQPVPQSFDAAVRANADSMGDMEQRRRAADVVRVAQLALEDELLSERRAAAAANQEQMRLRDRIEELEAQVAGAQAQAPPAGEAA